VLGGAAVPTVLVFLYIGWTSAGVDNWGHVGGLSAGVILTSLLRPRLLAGPRPTREALRRRLLPLALVALALWGGSRILGAVLPSMVPARFGDLELQLPSGWIDHGDGVIDNDMPAAARATLLFASADQAADEDLEAAARRWTRDQLVSEEAEGRLAEPRLGPMRYVHLLGTRGMVLEASFTADSTPMTLEAYFVPVPDGLAVLAFSRPEALTRYRGVFRKIAESLRTAPGKMDTP
jgi:hypothetical protein